jgi:hypothetical protein
VRRGEVAWADGAPVDREGAPGGLPLELEPPTPPRV